MPAAPQPFPFRAGEVTLGAGGEIASVDRSAEVDRRIWSAADGSWRPSPGVSIDWSATGMTVDVDEVELRGQLGHGVTVTLRHSFAAGWGVRLVLANEGSGPIALEPRLGWVPSPDCPAFSLAAGATGGYAVCPDDGAGPLLGGELTRGSLVWVDAEWLGLGRIELPPLGRYVVQWQWDWYTSPQRFERGRFPSVPRQLVLRTGEIARIAAGDDEAVVARGADLDPRAAGSSS